MLPLRRFFALAVLAVTACAAPDAPRAVQLPARDAPPPVIAPLPAPSPFVTSPPPPPEPEPEPVPIADPGRANRDPSDDGEVGPPAPIADCGERLQAAGVKRREGRLPVRKSATGHVCGTEQALIYEKGPTGVGWSAPPVGTCALLLGLARFEQIVQEEAERAFGERVKRIIQGGTYSCRKMSRFRMASEHSYGNAIDIYGFVLASGRTIGVKRHYGKLGEPATTPESRFLRAVGERSFDEDVFSVVLTPYWDTLHADHFHLDQARYRVNATRPR